MACREAYAFNATLSLHRDHAHRDSASAPVLDNRCFLVLPGGNLSVLHELTAMYAHCGSTEQEDLTPMDFPSDHKVKGINVAGSTKGTVYEVNVEKGEEKD